ncbi:MAG: SUMF1/EgtB/PvdO family nonheme iron enzyme, partial [Acidobacteria bacterium]|nr:SUMF1/EgtB/PvdO family nonheme iron enzyme [Acidobacteriota bacterium]
RASLFTGFVRQALKRESGGDLFQLQSGLLVERDHEKLTSGKWRNPCELPEWGVLVPKLSELAFAMQKKGLETEGAQVRIDYDDACDLIAHQQAENILKAGIALNVLDKDLVQFEITFFHQLLQEYFAARKLAKEPNPSLVHVEWEAAKVSPTLAETIAKLADGDPLPPLAQTGWEETTLTAAPMAKDPEAFIRALMPENLALAARCAASPEANISPELKREIQNQLITRTKDMTADLRARITAGEALGLIGDPRFERRRGEYGDYLLPPLVTIPAGKYTIGDNQGEYDRERPAGEVQLDDFQIGQFPVTNAEYKLFMEAGGYEDERWWDTPESLAWLRGEASTDGSKQQMRETRKTIQGMSEDGLRDLAKQGRVTSEQAEGFITIRNWAEEQFEQWLGEIYPSGKTYRQPEYWDDARFNNPAQPVVGVTWFEVRAYCNWLTANAAKGQVFRLPTEAEFEAAARGKKGRQFSYGNQFDSARCNTFESHIRRTTPVGVFENSTPEGAFDLSGNAYTWTLSIYDQERFPYPYRSDDGREDISATGVKRVLRGGSWFDGQLIARAVYRNLVLPAFRGNSFGFRVLCCRPPSSS